MQLFWWLKTPRPTIDEVLASPDHKTRDVLLALIREFECKSHRHELIAKFGTAIIVVVSATVPLALLASTHWHGFALSKLVPGVLAAIAAFAAGWLQFERPYEVWATYRTCYRDLLGHLVRYDAGAKPYDHRDLAHRDRALACTIAKYERQVEIERDSFLPSSNGIAQNVKASS